MAVQIKNTSQSYGFVSQFFHWLMALLIITTFVSGVVFENSSPDDPYFGSFVVLHKSFGILILFLVLLRVVWRVINPSPALPEDTHLFLRIAAFLTHWALYACMILLPLSGIMSTFNAGFELPFFYIFSISSPLETNYALAKTIIGAHHTLTKVLLALVGLHVVAALKHHYWNKDDVLVRMLDVRQPFFRFFR